MLIAGVLLLHIAAVGGVPWAWPPTDDAPRPMTAPMQLRVIEEARPATPVEAPAARAVQTALAPFARQAPWPARTADSPALPMAETTANSSAAIAPAAKVPDTTVLALDSEHGPEASAVVSAGGADAGDPPAPPLPHYRTQLPPAFTLQYELQRGMLRGSGELAWRPERDRYELKLTGKVGGLSALTQVSTGGFDASGLAPVRFTDQRLSRAPRAANFQREAGKITFSGPSTEYMLVPGSQDRLSWMIELAAIASAEPSLRAAGTTVSMFVVGSRGEADVWVFRCLGPETIDTPGGSVAAVKFMREPRDEHDTNVQIWLDPRRHWLPVQARQQSGSGDDAFELRLQSMASPPP